MASSSDDELPLAARPRKSALVNLDSDDSSLPSWLAEHKSPAAGGRLPSTSSDSSDVEEVAQRTAAPEPAGTQAQAPAHPSSQQGAETSQEPPSQPQPPPKGSQAQQQQQQPGATPPPASARKRRGAVVGGEAAGAVAGSDADHAASQQPPTAQKSAQKRGTGAHHASANELPVVLPDKLPQMKMLVELESVEGGATDLAGDAGAVGRMLVTGPPGDQQVQIDLKGMLYSATIVPCPVTMAVVNVGPTEAKMESLFSEFLQLREDTRFSCLNSGPMDLLAGDDEEDNYMLAGGANEGDEEGGKGKKGGARKKAAAEGKGGAGGKAASKASKGLKKTVGGGVKKPRGGGGGAKGKAKLGQVKRAAAKPAKPRPKAKPAAAKKAAGGKK